MAHPTISLQKYYSLEGIVIKSTFGALGSLFIPWSMEDHLSNPKMSRIPIEKLKSALLPSLIISSPLLI